MLYTTFALAHNSKACIGSYYKMAEALGGVTHYGKDTPFSLAQVVEVLGLEDAIWCLRCTTAPAEAENILIELVCQVADLRAATIARCLTDKSPEARAAAYAAYAAYAAAAAGDAEREWQTQIFLTLLEGA